MAFELSDKKWLPVVSDGVRGPSRYTVDAGDERAVLDAIGKAKARCGLMGDVVVRSCYEAAATASGCIAGCLSKASTTSWWTRPASRRIMTRVSGGADPRPKRERLRCQNGWRVGMELQLHRHRARYQ